MPNYRLEEDSVQWQFHQSRVPIQVFGGAFANGKSTAMIIKALRLVTSYPGSSGLMARATYPKLNGTLRKDFLSWCPKNWVKKLPTQDDNSCIMRNGTTVAFRYIAQRGKNSEDGSTTSNLLSATYDWIVVDQMEDPEIQYKDFLDLIGRLRGQTPYRPSDVEDSTMPSSGPRWLMIGLNPTQNWTYREIIHPLIMFRDKGIRSNKLIVDPETLNPIIELYESDTYANRKNLSEDYIRNLEATYKGQMRERYLLGKWAAFEGLVYPHFDMHKHLITREQAMLYLQSCIDRHVCLRPLEGYDFGQVSPSCYLLGFIDDWGRVIIVDGYHKPEFGYDQQPAAIKEIRAKYFAFASSYGVNNPIHADPSIFRRQVVAKQEAGTTVARLMSDFNLHLRPAQNDIIPGIAKVNGYLSDRPDTPHIVTGEISSPMIYFVDDLNFVAEEFGSYYWKRNPQGVHIDEPVDHNDHAMDAVKYMLSRLPEPSKIEIPSKKLPPQWAFWHEMDQSEFDRVARVSR